MAALVAVARLVPRVRLEETLLQVVQRRALQGLDEEPPQVGHLHVADDGTEALDDGDDREGPHHRIAHALEEQEARLLRVRVLRRHELARDLHELGALSREPRLPGPDRRTPVQGARGAIGAVGIEAAVAAHAVGNERLRVVTATQQLVALEDEPLRGSRGVGQLGSSSGALFVQ